MVTLTFSKSESPDQKMGNRDIVNHASNQPSASSFEQSRSSISSAYLGAKDKLSVQANIHIIFSDMVGCEDLTCVLERESQFDNQRSGEDLKPCSYIAVECFVSEQNCRCIDRPPFCLRGSSRLYLCCALYDCRTLECEAILLWSENPRISSLVNCEKWN